MLLHKTSGQWRLGLSLSVLTALFWGVIPVAETVMLQALDVYTLNWFRFLSSFGLLTVYLAIRRQLPLQKASNGKQTAEKKASPIFYLSSLEIGLLAIATVALAISYVFYLQGLVRTSPASAEVLIQLAPVLMGLGAIVIFKERYTLEQWAGVGVLALGFTLFFHEKVQALITAQTRYLLGSGLIMLAAIVWAVYALAQKQLLQRLPSSSIMWIIYGVCTLLFSPFAAPQDIPALSPLYLGTLVFCGLSTTLTYSAFSESLEHWEASKVSAVISSTPVVTLTSVWAMSHITPTLVAPEHITVLGLLGAVLVISGSMIIALGANRK